MKKKSVKKLTLSKATLANLENTDMTVLNGGGPGHTRLDPMACAGGTEPPVCGNEPTIFVIGGYCN